jgi:acyl-CoA reductase-like NAD-dependent aldehyde dehydrogenase
LATLVAYAPARALGLPRSACRPVGGPGGILWPVELANGTDFGLGATVWSRDIERANSLASRIECGMVFINDIVHSDPRAPFGGVKASGIGRELGVPGALELSNPKLIWQGG